MRSEVPLTEENDRRSSSSSVTSTRCNVGEFIVGFFCDELQVLASGKGDGIARGVSTELGRERRAKELVVVYAGGASFFRLNSNPPTRLIRSLGRR